MDYLKYGKKSQQQPKQKPQPQGFIDIPQKNKSQPQRFGKNVQVTKDDFSFGDLTHFDYADGVNPTNTNTNSNNQKFFGKQPQPQSTMYDSRVVQQPEKQFDVESRRNDSGDELLQVFPVPVLICPCPLKYDQELEMFRKEPYSNAHLNDYNLNNQSEDKFILDRPELAKIRLWFEEKIRLFAKEILLSKNDLCITQSWLNKNKKGERHHTHTHPNSVISGVWYPYIHEKLPPIEFKKASENEVQAAPEKFNLYNSGSFLLPMKMGELVVFPSNTKHSVPSNQSDEERISLSFNTWFKGNFGNKDSLTYLPMDRCV